MFVHNDIDYFNKRNELNIPMLLIDIKYYE